ncbi:PfkB family carbohydrate kinase [Pseudonocardia spinosispora]|uniref:PfkB family carbohydrate kinase n=1 Tax=Pseudonocardia spinosispora TaxID=103441 RepID=UPI000420BEEC|nr:PfkB family carbohydrate kinase [Pseudonocardia spinosispora]
MTGSLIHTGQVLVDLVMRVPSVPAVGGDVLASATSFHPGGGFNVMAAASRAGARVVYTGGHGTGRFGDAVRAALAEEGVEAALAATPDVDTGVCVVLVDDAGERTFVTGSGAETAVDAGALASIPVRTEDIVYVSGYSLLAGGKAQVLLDFVEQLAGAMLMMDPGPLVADIDDRSLARLLSHTTVLSCNAREARLLTGLDDPRAAGPALAGRMSRGATVVLRDGARGCLLVRDGELGEVPGHEVEAVDTNGAGDAHCGVLAAELLRGADLQLAARRANIAAALAVTIPGPATAPSRAAVDAVLLGRMC